ncbi:MAG: hypothetical protein N5P05_004118 (plasmid) [Chroococcopsis gigantea SAG 12.99]|jgi:hypothetical protein|nr:hypothetical protein [Chroococcopsis gigantea SAG 12.99]
MTFSVFGTRPQNAICLPDIPYAVRFNCKDGAGGIFVGGSDPQHRKSNPDDKIDINIIKVSKFFGTLGKTENVLWIQLFFIPGPSVPAEILPPNTVCVGYIKKQSIAALFNTVQSAMNSGEPALGIFTLGFQKELGANGAYYSVCFNWRERQTDGEKAQLELIAGFMAEHGNKLIDLESTRMMTCVDGLSAQEIMSLIAAPSDYGNEQPSLPAGKSQARLKGR